MTPPGSEYQKKWTYRAGLLLPSMQLFLIVLYSDSPRVDLHVS